MYLNKFKFSALPWIIWLLGAGFYAYKYVLEVSPSVMGPELMRAFHISGAQLGNLAAFYFYAYLIMQIPAGILLDRYGPRFVTTACIFVCALGALVLAISVIQASQYPAYPAYFYLAEAGRFMMGAGAAVSALSVFKLVTLWFPPKRFALLAGLILTAGMLGAVCGQAPLVAAIETYGWDESLLFSAGFGFVLMGIYWLIVRDQGPFSRPLHMKRKNSFLSGFIQVIKKRQNWILSVYSGLTFAPIMVFGGLWGVPYLQAMHHFSRIDAAQVVSLIFIGFAVGSPLLGWFSDYLGKRWRVMAVGSCVSLISCIIAIYAPHLSAKQMSVVLFIFGFSISSFLLCFSMIRENNHLTLSATALGFMNAFNALLGAIADPFIGYLLDLSWKGDMDNGARIFTLADYHSAMLMLPLFLLAALTLLIFIKETNCKQYTGEADTEINPQKTVLPNIQITGVGATGGRPL